MFMWICRDWRIVNSAILVYRIYIHGLVYPQHPPQNITFTKANNLSTHSSFASIIIMGRVPPNHDFQRVTYFTLNLDAHCQTRDTITFKTYDKIYEKDWPVEKFFNWFYLTTEKLKELRVFDLFAARTRITWVNYNFAVDRAKVWYRQKVGNKLYSDFTLAELSVVKSFWETSK